MKITQSLSYLKPSIQSDNIRLPQKQQDLNSPSNKTQINIAVSNPETMVQAPRMQIVAPVHVPGFANDMLSVMNRSYGSTEYTGNTGYTGNPAIDFRGGTTMGSKTVESSSRKENGKTSGTIKVTDNETGNVTEKKWDDTGYTTTHYDSNGNVTGSYSYTYEARINEPVAGNSSKPTTSPWGGLVYTNPGWRGVPENLLGSRLNLLI